MKTNKLPKSALSDYQAAGSQSSPKSHSSVHFHIKENDKSKMSSNDNASNDADYIAESLSAEYDVDESKADTCFSQLAKEFQLQNEDSGLINHDINYTEEFSKASSICSGYKTSKNSGNLKTELYESSIQPSRSSKEISNNSANETKKVNQNLSDSKLRVKNSNNPFSPSQLEPTKLPERIFMNGLIKHTAIALAIIVPLAAFSAYAATPPITMKTTDTTVNNKAIATRLSVDPKAIIHKSANVPTTVNSVDLKKYAGKWYEIGRLPMYFQRNCVGDVTASYIEKTDGSGIKVINQCVGDDGVNITAEGIAKPADATGSKLKVTFLPQWIRWLPVGRADYWVLARDADYKTALVGTPDKDYLWLLARSPNISQETYAKYRQIAQQQGYDLKEFKLTPQTNQTVNLIP